ncbi:MAG TPA: alpha/beta hydrolase fold domain-containing protein, partial [Methanocorpusculum sp.]|nr:alpha/beta hydrolase fold domain-containing protein [Methanocorpusculum sp.]
MTEQFDHARDDPRLNEEAREFLRTRPENLGDVWERIVRDAVGGDTAELSRVRNKRSVETPAPEGVEIMDADANGVPVRLYLPASRNRPKKIVLYFHGGGWVIGSIQSGSRFCGELAKAADVIVAAAAYRLAPEFPYPAAVKDCREVYLWIRRHATDYGGDDGCIYAAGDSAGGNLAVVLALQERLCGLMLFYPVTTVVP